MANYNKVMLMGNLTRDPQLRYTPNKQAVCDFGLAINRKWKGADGQMHEDVCFVDCSAWAGRGEVIAKYLTKGQPIFVEGRLNYRTWDGPDGKKRSKLDVVVDQFQFIGGKAGGQGGPRPAPQQQSQDTQRQETSGAQDQTPPAGSDYDFTQDVEDNTIPF